MGFRKFQLLTLWCCSNVFLRKPKIRELEMWGWRNVRAAAEAIILWGRSIRLRTLIAVD